MLSQNTLISCNDLQSKVKALEDKSKRLQAQNQQLTNQLKLKENECQEAAKKLESEGLVNNKNVEKLQDQVAY